MAKIRISLWLPDDLHERLKRAAKADDRTIASFVIAVLRRALDARDGGSGGGAR